MHIARQFLSKQRGIGLVTAIFLLVVMLGLGLAIVSLSTTQQVAGALDLQGARAYQAARAGAEWGVFRAANGNCAASTSFTLPSPMDAFAVTVLCTQTQTPVADGELVTRFRILSTACTLSTACPNAASTSLDYVQRVVEVRFGE
jgi:MSHA biogenesis protein MshP